MQAIIFLAETALPLLALIVIIHLIYAKKWFEIIQLIIVSTLAYSVEKLIQVYYIIDRPFIANNIEPLIPHAPTPSFPSSHAAAAFILAYFAYKHNERLGKISFALAILIALSRVLAHLHYYTDIVAGAIIGLALCYVVERLFNHFCSW